MLFPGMSGITESPGLLLLNLAAFSTAILLHGLLRNWIDGLLWGRSPQSLLRYIDPAGLLYHTLFFIGWARPRSMEEGSPKGTRSRIFWCGMIGPSLFFTLGFIGTILLVSTAYLGLYYMGDNVIRFFFRYAPLYFSLFLGASVRLGVLSFFPLLPFDGGYIIYSVLPKHLQKSFIALARYSTYVIAIVLLIPQVRNTLFGLGVYIAGVFAPIFFGN